MGFTPLFGSCGFVNGCYFKSKLSGERLVLGDLFIFILLRERSNYGNLFYVN